MACGSLQEGFKVDTLANAGNKQPFNSEGGMITALKKNDVLDPVG